MICPSCQIDFEPKKFNQRFCSQKCKSKYWNGKMLDNIHNLRLTPQNYASLKAYAEAQGVPFDIMGNEMFHKLINPDGGPMEDIAGDGSIK